MRRIAVTVTFAVLAAIVVVAVESGPASAAACTKTWANTATSGLWDQVGVANGTDTQWAPVGVPTATDVVCLPAGGAYTVTIGAGDLASFTIAELHVGDGGSSPQPTLIVNAGKSLTVNGAVTQAGGHVTVVGILTAITYGLTGGDLDGTGTIAADLTNSGGTFQAGAASVPGDSFLALNGSYVQTAGGTYHVDLDGQLNGVNQDHVHASESATLAGLIEIDMTVVPSPPAQVMIATQGITGTFTSAVGGPADWVGILLIGDGPPEQVV